jgi:predicted permease
MTMRELARRLWYLCNRGRLEREMADEMAWHREQMRADGRGDFGSDLRLREETREIWGWAWLDRLRQDLAYGARVLRNSPGFTLTAMVVLALGIGVPLTAFRVVLSDLRGRPAPDPDTLVHLTRRGPGVHITTVPYPQLAFYAAGAQSFRSVIGVSDRNVAILGTAPAGGPSEQVHLAFATVNYFMEFGITALRGRRLGPDDERPDAEPAAMVGELFWQRRFGGDPAVIGQWIRVNGKPVRLVGVIPVSARTRADLWMPLVRQPYVIEGSALLTDWNSALDGYARLKPGVTPKAAEEETRALAAKLRELRPHDVRQNEYLEARPILQFDDHSNEFRIALTAAGLVMLMLVAACANLGTLVLARGVTREREIRTRMALGAGRARIVRQLFTESLLLAVLSGLCGLVLSSLALKAIQLQHNPTGSILPDWRVVGVTCGVALLAALIFGLPPALRLTSHANRGGRARTIFLSAQIAASFLLLFLSSLFVTSLQRFGASDPGFDYRHLVSIAPGLKAHGYSGPAAQAYLDSLRASASAVPGVRAVSEAWLAPWGNIFTATGWEGHRFAGNHVAPEFLDTMGMRLLKGRNFRPGDADVAIVTEAAARVLWPDGQALGKKLPWDAHGPTVIGVARNASTTAVGDPKPLEYYLTQSTADAPGSVVVVRVTGNPRESVRLLQAAAISLDKRLQPVVQVVSDAYDREVEDASRALAVIAGLGVVAILLSAIGLAGLAGYTVAQRTREIGLRIALGARGGQVVGAILAPLSRSMSIGLVCGAVGGSAAAVVLRSGIAAMAGLRLFDPLAYLMAGGFFAVVVALAVLAPGRRAMRIDPSRALQHE